MQQALDAARQGQGFCAPNPAVGAVVVRDGAVIATGFHSGPGTPHAEVEALRQLARDVSDCELYVTLEPCCHHGRTPPCTDLIIERRLKRVFFAFLDPNPEVAGQGRARLNEAGVECLYAPTDEVTHFYRAYQHWWRYKRPWITAKLAIDDAHRLAIGALTGDVAQRYTHHQRLLSDALFTSLKTIAHDDPQFNTRLVDVDAKKPLYLLDTAARLPVTARVIETCHPVTIFYHQADALRLNTLRKAGVTCVAVRLIDGYLDLQDCLRYMGEVGHHSVWLESGWTSTASFLQQGLVNELLLYVAKQNPAVDCRDIAFVPERGQDRHIEFSPLGSDLLIRLSS